MYMDIKMLYNLMGEVIVLARPKTKTTAQIKNDYARKVYDDVRLQVKKGQKEIIKAHAEVRGESLNGFINRAIQEAMERDNAAYRATEDGTDTKEEAEEYFPGFLMCKCMCTNSLCMRFRTRFFRCSVIGYGIIKRDKTLAK